jgi:hypothetical protein
MQDGVLQRVLAEAVDEVYSERMPLRAEGDGASLMYCFVAAHNSHRPRAAERFVLDICAPQRRASDACALLLISIPDMTVRPSRLSACPPAAAACAAAPASHHLCAACRCPRSRAARCLRGSMCSG